MKDLTQNPYGKYNGEEQEYVLRALDSDYTPEQSWAHRLEKDFCQAMGVKYAIACNSGTSGLHAAMIAASVGEGDEVISPALTVIMDAFATLHVGAVPVFADVNPDTWTIDPEDVRRKITGKTKAIITVSLQGLPVDIDPIMKVAGEHDVIVVEDSAQTMLGAYHGRMAGTLGHIGVFSFENKKHMTCGSEGGMIVSNDARLAERARKFAGIGYKHMTPEGGATSLAISTVQDPSYERFDTIGLNYRMPEVCAAIGVAQFRRIESTVSRRRAVAALFDEAVEGCDWITKQYIPDGYVHSYYTYAVQYRGDEKVGLSWKEFYNRYREMGGDGFYGACKIPYLEPVFRNSEGNGIKLGPRQYQKGLCPVAERLQPRIMQFKTNYRDIDDAKRKAEILHALIRSLG